MAVDPGGTKGWMWSKYIISMYEIFKEFKNNNVLLNTSYNHSINFKYITTQIFLTVTKYLKKKFHLMKGLFGLEVSDILSHYGVDSH